MMKTTSNKKGMPPIRNVDELHRAMHGLKQRIRQRERNLEQAWQELPAQTIKATLGAVVPIFLQNRMASGTWKLIKGLFGLFSGKTGGQEEAGWKSSLLAGARRLGLFTLLKFVFDQLGRKKSGK